MFRKVYFKKVIVYKNNHFLGVKEIFENLDFYYYSARAKTNMTYYYINLNNIKKCFLDFPKFKEFFFKHNKMVVVYLNKLEKKSTYNFGEIKNRRKNLNVTNDKKGILDVQTEFSNKFLWNTNKKKKKKFQNSKFNKNFKIKDLKILKRDKNAIRLMNFSVKKKVKTSNLKENIFKNYENKDYIGNFTESLAQKINDNVYNKLKKKKTFSIKTNRNFQMNFLRTALSKNFF